MHRRAPISALTLALALSAGCGENAAENKPAAVTGPAQPVTPAAPAATPAAAAPTATAATPAAEPAAGPALAAPTAAPAGALAFSNENGSTIKFVGSKSVGGSHDGGFGVFNGTIELAADAPAIARITADIVMDSTFSDAEKLTGHLKNEDFFDVPKFPRSSFITTEIKPGGDNGASHTVTGNLTLHGVTKSITFPATIAVTADEAKLTSEFFIKKNDFGITYSGPGGVIRDEVVIKLDIKAARPKG